MCPRGPAAGYWGYCRASCGIWAFPVPPTVTMHIVRKLGQLSASICWKASCSCSGLRVYTRHFFKHVSWPMLGGLLTALTDETIQLFVPGRSGQVTDIWIDFSGVTTGLLVGLILLGLVRMCIILYQHRNEV